MFFKIKFFFIGWRILWWFTYPKRWRGLKDCMSSYCCWHPRSYSRSCAE